MFSNFCLFISKVFPRWQMPSVINILHLLCLTAFYPFLFRVAVWRLQMPSVKNSASSLSQQLFTHFHLGSLFWGL